MCTDDIRFFLQSGPKKKKGQPRELKLEAFSVSQNFDPETYVIPLQNRWTVESEGYSKNDTASTFNETIEQNKSIDELVSETLFAEFDKVIQQNP